MTREQFRREQRVTRQRELEMLSREMSSTDPRYLRDAAAWVWNRILDRKLQVRTSLSSADRQRVDTLIALHIPG